LQLAALQRDEAEANQKLIAALQARQDVRPWLREIRDILLQRAATSEAFGTNANEVAALCRQSAHAIEKILSS
jgi:hypothetical protein